MKTRATKTPVLHNVVSLPKRPKLRFSVGVGSLLHKAQDEIKELHLQMKTTTTTTLAATTMGARVKVRRYHPRQFPAAVVRL